MKSRTEDNKNNPWGWARTGLEPEVLVDLNDRELDAILDLGCTSSFVDQEIIDDLGIEVKPFNCAVSHCVSLGTSPARTSHATFKVLGCSDITLGILGMGLVQSEVWIVKSLISKGVPMVIGSDMIKKIFGQANVERIDCWQQPWKFLYESYMFGAWSLGECSEELSTTNSSFEILHQNLSPCPHPRCSSPSEEVVLRQVEQQITTSSSTALKGIPGPLEEPDGQEDSVPAA